ncbi:GtrA family protein [Sulfitobacter sp. F26204]|uniref:GtrA family protein n=1 Tax=Sulfitobacter sp. F26204 TaxID=2996014 RepID=UPI00225DF489|nr:GtrA family protein [Sulfitobacter sp. F26204]MCX7558738.1 GtrA family protein [Sulfitobacter sp. F26204]
MSASAQTPVSTILQILRFAGIGLCATFVHVAVALAVGLVFQIGPMVANLAGFSVAFGVSFLGHARFTFRVDAPDVVHLRRFLALSACSLVLSSAITALATGLGASLAQAMICVGFIVPALSFIGARFWAFSDRATP